MRKPKFIFKVNQNNTAKVYVGDKWHKYVQQLEIVAKPQNILVTITEYKLNKKGVPYVIDNEVVSKTKTYFFGDKWVRR